MQRFEGEDIWACEGIAWIVIPTNVGYKKLAQDKVQPARHVGPNVMGRGLARDAATKYPWLPELYGEFCWLHGEDTPVTFDMRSRTVLFPTKPMNTNEPWMSWKGKSCIDRIRTSARQLNALILPDKDAYYPRSKPLKTNHIVVPFVGCGNGGLDEEEVIPILEEVLDDRHTLFVHRPF